MSFNPLLLENQLCFPLYACAREVVKRYKPHLDKIGLTYTQYITMLVLWETESVNVKSLGDALYLDSGTLTPLLKKMEVQGLITRKRDPEDERNLIISLTQQGAQLRERALDIPASIAGCLNLDPEKAFALRSLLMDMLEQF